MVWVVRHTGQFGPGRSKLFPNSADDQVKVHDLGPHEADVTEGGRGTWERPHYDWSDPDRIVLTTTDSNVWRGDSGHTYTSTRRPDGRTDVDVDVVRDGKNLKGRALELLFRAGGKRVWSRRSQSRWRPSKRGTAERDASPLQSGDGRR